MLASNHLIRGAYGLSLLLLQSLLLGCQAASNDLAGAIEEPAGVTEIQRPPTALLTTIPTDRPTIVTTDSPTAVSTYSPTTIPTDNPVATAVNSDNPAIMNENEQEANADVEFVRAVQSADGSWTFHVTVRHPDNGWEDYANGWDVVLTDGSILKRGAGDPFTRLLLHPHESEQPFTRSQGGLVIPAGNSQVAVRAHDLVNGFGGRQVIVDLNVSAGPDFEVERQ